MHVVGGLLALRARAFFSYYYYYYYYYYYRRSSQMGALNWAMDEMKKEGIGKGSGRVREVFGKGSGFGCGKCSGGFKKGWRTFGTVLLVPRLGTVCGRGGTFV